MRIHLTGTNWHAATTQNLKKAFEALGHDVLFFNKHLSRNWKIAENLASRLVRRKYKVENYFFNVASKKWLESIKLYKPDLIVIEDAPNIFAEYIERARAFKVPIFYYEISPPFGSGGDGARDVLLSFKYVDEAFCIDREWAKTIEVFFPKKVRHLPLAGNPDDFYPIPDEKKIYDVAMVASASEQSAYGLVRANLMNDISDKLRVAVFGSGWGYWIRYFPKLKRLVRSMGVPSIPEVNRIYNQSKIVINFHSPGHTKSISSRTFEIALSSAFQIVDHRDDLSLLFPKYFFPMYADSKGANAQIADWLPRDAERQENATSAREYVLQHHTWKHRAEEILNVYKNYA